MKKILTAIIFYILRREKVNNFYNLCVEEGYCQDETYSWLQRTLYYMAFLEKTYGE